MPDLPNVGWERDMESFQEFFENPAFRTDGLKLYPTLVIRGTGLYELWKKGIYKNYPPDKVGMSMWLRRVRDGRFARCESQCLPCQDESNLDFDGLPMHWLRMIAWPVVAAVSDT